MAEKGIREFDAKRMLTKALIEASGNKISCEARAVLVTPETDLDTLEQENPWLKETTLVVKPDQLFGKRGKNNLILLNKNVEQARDWIRDKMNREVTIKQTTGKTTGTLSHFLIEPFRPHNKEYYVAITTKRDKDILHFSPRGGVDIEEIWDSVVTVDIPISFGMEMEAVSDQTSQRAEKATNVEDLLKLLENDQLPTEQRTMIKKFVETLGSVDIPVSVGMDAEGSGWEDKFGSYIDDLLSKFSDEEVPAEDKPALREFLVGVYKVFVDYYFSYLEFNPFSVNGKEIILLDAVAKLDDYASYQSAEVWGKMEFPKAFGLSPKPEERRVEEIDSRTGASLKLTVLNAQGRIWNLVAGGGASVIYADTVVDLGFANELANYGEYSGNPSAEDTYEYAKTVLDLMTREKDARGRPKFLIIGGGIANFTDVAKTFTGIILALQDYQEQLRETDVRIYVRRGGPNYEAGLEKMKTVGKKMGLPIKVFGPETHMTKIVSMALKED